MAFEWRTCERHPTLGPSVIVLARSDGPAWCIGYPDVFHGHPVEVAA
jgi:hypothetical protein